MPPSPRLSLFTWSFGVLFSLNALSLAAANDQTEIIMLSGNSRADAVEWDFRSAGGRRSGEWTKIAVPSCWEQEGFGHYHYGQVEGFPPVVTATYRRKFHLAAFADRRVRLCFEGVMTDATVKVNARTAGPVHQGGFSPFHYDVTALVHPGENEIEVLVRDQSSDPGVNQSERFADFWVFGGIHRPVYLELLPASFIDRVAIDARADGTFRLDVFPGEGTSATRVTARVSDLQGTLLGEPVTASRPEGARRLHLETRYAQAKLWSPETPTLYRVEVSLEDAGRSLHRVTTRFGFRTFEVLKDRGFRLNGRRILLKGVCRPSFRPETGRTLSAADSLTDVKLMKEMNANAVRCVHYPADRHFLDACDELGLIAMTEVLAWHSPLPDVPGAQLVRELVTRDQNHPCIVMWANGNHRGFNPNLERVFQEYDLQDRRALRLEPKVEGLVPQPARPEVVPVETRMYPSFAQLSERLTQPWPVLPVEALHALYDGGGAAGLAEFWRALENSPVGGGLFIWEFVDEAIARTDRNGELDSAGNRSADGLVGPHHEREAGFFAARDIFSPVQVESAAIGPGRSGRVVLRNKHAVTDLGQCRFVRHLVNAATPLARETRRLPAPACAPGATAALDLDLPADTGTYDFVVLEAQDPAGAPLREWSWPLRERSAHAPIARAGGSVTCTETNGRLEARAGALRLVFDGTTARLLEVHRQGQLVPFGRGPDLAWSAPADNVLPAHLRDGVARTVAPANPKKKSAPTSRPGRLADATPGASQAVVRHLVEGACEITASGTRGFDRIAWTLSADGTLRLDYAYRLEGNFDSFGITFDSDAAAVQSVTWLGAGPYPVWRNRPDGSRFGLWTKPNNGAVPGRRFDYPIFEGCHAETVWLRFDTAAGAIRIWLESPELVARWFTPQWGETPVNAVAALPPGDVSFLHVMPGIGDKWMPAAELSPSGRPMAAAGSFAGKLTFRFE